MYIYIYIHTHTYLKNKYISHPPDTADLNKKKFHSIFTAILHKNVPITAEHILMIYTENSHTQTKNVQVNLGTFKATNVIEK